VTLSWRDVTYVVDNLAAAGKGNNKGGAKGKAGGAGGGAPARRVILDSLSGSVAPGRSLAVMGPSGSGKTTLLNVLSRRVRAPDPPGDPGIALDGESRTTRFDVRLNGEQTSEELSRRFGAFVAQDDYLPGTLTVREAIRFNADLRLAHLNREDREARISGVIAELGLNKVADSLIGFSGQDALNTGLKRSLSGGERKRVSIALELVTNPSLIYADEPTTGLDSFAAISVVNTLLGLARRSGRTVIFTIHQPSSEIWDLLDSVLLLGRGRTIYYGPASQAVPHFSELGLPPPPYENPADHLLRAVHVDTSKVDAREEALALLRGDGEHNNNDNDNNKNNNNNGDDDKAAGAVGGGGGGGGAKRGRDHDAAAVAQVLRLSKAYAKSDARRAADEEWEAQDKETAVRARAAGGTSGSLAAADRARRGGFFAQGKQVAIRSLKNLVREPMNLIGAIAQSVIFALIVGLLFGRLEYSQRNVRDRLGVIFFSTIFLFFNSLFAPVFLFAAERTVFLRQYSSGLLDVLPYFLFRTLAELPKLMLAPTCFSCVFYFIVNLRYDAGAFFKFVLTMCTQAYAGFVFGVFVVVAVPDPATALQILPVLFIPLMLLSGLLISPPNIPPWMKPFEFISFTRYSFHALVQNDFEGATFVCTDDELEIAGGTCPITTGAEALEFNGFNETGFSFWVNLIILFALASCYHIASFFLLLRSARRAK
jgi:ATP-binding cassette subfamily G (WHITE) protein 2